MKTMKKQIYTVALGWGLVGLLSGCNDSFLERYPETTITEKVYFRNVGDLESYTNNMYGYLGSSYWDVVSDNVLYKEESSTYAMLRGELNADDAGTWGWGSIRNVNFMLARTGNVTGDRAEINHYIGIARMMRAKLYYDKVKDYSDVPWYSRDLQTTDIEELYKPQDPRELVVDSIMADLDFAVKNMKPGASKTRIYRNVALALQARIALYEGTFRKYHTELGLDDADRFLQIAVSAAEQLMDGTYSLSEVKSGNLEAYESLFCSLDLTTNPEMILVEDYDKTLGRLHNAQQVCDFYNGLSKDLMEDYLVVEGNQVKTFQSVPGYETKTYKEIFENRDPRLRQTFMWPGYKKADENEPHRLTLGAGGYPQIKFDPRTYDQLDWGVSYTDLPVFRYAEILLIYAEAKAELGILTQEDVDKSINLIRKRVGMPGASLSDWLADIDPVQERHYPNVISAQKGAILEIRRERRVELACEGFRYGDLMRWSCGKLMEKAPEGMYIPKLGMYDTTGDGNPDFAIVKSEAEANQIPAEDKEKYRLTIYVLEGNTIGLTEGDKGYIRLVSQVGKFTFEEPKYYYYPLDTDDLKNNKNLVQNKYWATK
ncbi:MAG: RagB/SusD family nutrient uptake outer membrane protein [Bacteroides sp.]|nr:RagB/SusD family nutrient uptake outer membrane protein [Bacteroides sp.]